MIKSTLGITREPFCRADAPLLTQQSTAVDMIKSHAQHGGFSVIVGAPGVGKSAIRAHLEQWVKQRDTVVASFTQTMHSYRPILRQLAESMQLAGAANALEKELIKAAWHHAQAQKTLYTVIDEAHLLDTDILRRLRLLFERFPAKHNLVLLGHPELMQRLALLCNEDIKSRISYSQQLLPLNDLDLASFIIAELAAVGLGALTFDDGALQVITRAVQGNLRLCRNLCYASLVAACMEGQRACTVSHVNTALVQPHWRTHEALHKRPAAPPVNLPLRVRYSDALNGDRNEGESKGSVVDGAPVGVDGQRRVDARLRVDARVAATAAGVLEEANC